MQYTATKWLHQEIPLAKVYGATKRKQQLNQKNLMWVRRQFKQIATGTQTKRPVPIWPDMRGRGLHNEASCSWTFPKYHWVTLLSRSYLHFHSTNNHQLWYVCRHRRKSAIERTMLCFTRQKHCEFRVLSEDSILTSYSLDQGTFDTKRPLLTLRNWALQKLFDLSLY